MSIKTKLLDYVNGLLLFYPESRLFLFLFLISYLFGLLKNVSAVIAISQVFILLVGLRSIRCMIEGKCYSDIYLFLLVFTFTNIILVVLYDYFLLVFPRTTKKIVKDRDMDSESTYNEIVNDLPGLVKILKRKNFIKKEKYNNEVFYYN
tara:strand:+ start:865 stop:1311 length:447 start_codon:yes stop_codon:yes gene_type:complete